MAKFKTRQGAIIDDIKTYVANWIVDKPDIKIYIGCDSQRTEGSVHYAVSICMYNPGKGGHIVDRKTTYPADKTFESKNKEVIFERLWKEVEMSVEVADQLKDLNAKIIIHCDYNSDQSELSNRLYGAGIGYAMDLGYEAEGKPNAFAATYAADNAVR
jgi:predicted RNase H-related nuclease YkuK (DUF458 family)